MKFSKKTLSLVAAITLSIGLISCNAQNNKTTVSSPKGTEVTSDEAIKLLQEGNERYVTGKTLDANISDEKRTELFKDGQFPYAIVVGCSDSRVPVELLFNEGLGNIFVIRNAGNVIDQVSLGSVEYGAEHLHAPLIVVLGHQNCGAVKATVDGGQASENIEEIKDLITPAYDIAKKTTTDASKIYTITEDENIKNSIEEINKSEVIQELVNENKVKVVGAKYSLETGEVTFMD